MSRPVCARCTRPLSHCLCALIPALKSRTKVQIVQHPDEQHHALNTARLVALGLGSATLHIAQRLDPAILEALTVSNSWLLFPGEKAISVNEISLKNPPRQLVVLDGSWRKARKLLHFNPELAALPRVVLCDGQPSRYRVRKATQAGALATIEAIVSALNVLEAPNCFDELLKPFEALIEGQIQAMGPAVFAKNHRG